MTLINSMYVSFSILPNYMQIHFFSRIVAGSFNALSLGGGLYSLFYIRSGAASFNHIAPFLTAILCNIALQVIATCHSIISENYWGPLTTLLELSLIMMLILSDLLIIKTYCTLIPRITDRKLMWVRVSFSCLFLLAISLEIAHSFGILPIEFEYILFASELLFGLLSLIFDSWVNILLCHLLYRVSAKSAVDQIVLQKLVAILLFQFLMDLTSIGAFLIIALYDQTDVYSSGEFAAALIGFHSIFSLKFFINSRKLILPNTVSKNRSLNIKDPL